MADLEKIQKKLKKKLDANRYRHTLGVMYTAGALAMRYQENLEDALTAGLLHDCGKYGSVKDQIRLCRKNKLELSAEELKIPALIHAKLGARLAQKKYHIEDQRILDAIRYHTTGRPEMSILDKIIYLADYIEPHRKMIPGLSEIRRLSYIDLDQAVCNCADATLRYLQKAGRFVDLMTQETYAYYRKQQFQKEENKDKFEVPTNVKDIC
ncbi:MAG: HD domain-containing protein [Ruminococcus sp.]|nr:HD domain-containing protein [Ruminococcus sp.]